MRVSAVMVDSLSIVSATPAQPEFERFRQMVLRDETLHESLLSERNPDRFAMLAVALGRERGCHFDGATVLAAIQQARSAWLESWI